jgi:hypothetical protein
MTSLPTAKAFFSKSKFLTESAFRFKTEAGARSCIRPCLIYKDTNGRVVVGPLNVLNDKVS